MQNWLLQNLSDVLNREVDPRLGVTCPPDANEQAESHQHYRQKQRVAELTAQKEWCGAIAAVEELLLSEIEDNRDATPAKLGLVFSAPVPLLSNPELVANFQSAIFTPDAFKVNALMPCRHAKVDTLQNTASVIELPLIPQDPIAQEQFCFVLTANFGLVLLLGKDSEGNSKFHFSFDPITLGRVWDTLRSRLVIAKYHRLLELDSLVEQFAPPIPNYHLVTNFSRRLLHHIPDLDRVASNSRQVEAVAASELEPETETAFQSNCTTSLAEMELLIQLN